MKKNCINLIIAILFICPEGTKAQTVQTQPTKSSIETKLSNATWRTDYYICTGIAYAKSMGQSVEDFAEFVGKHHSLGDPNNATLASVSQTGHLVMTSYPGGR